MTMAEKDVLDNCLIAIKAIEFNFAVEKVTILTDERTMIHIQKNYTGNDNIQVHAVSELDFVMRYAAIKKCTIKNTKIVFNGTTGYSSTDIILPFEWNEQENDINFIEAE